MRNAIDTVVLIVSQLTPNCPSSTAALDPLITPAKPPPPTAPTDGSKITNSSLIFLSSNNLRIFSLTGIRYAGLNPNIQSNANLTILVSERDRIAL